MIALFCIALFVNTTIHTKQHVEEERVKIALEFALSFKRGLSNEEIMKKFVATGHYFNKDSTRWRSLADQYINDLRESAKQADEQVFHVYKYIGHEDEFAVRTSSSINDTPTMRRLTFSLDLADGREVDVDTNDVYVLSEKNSKGKGLFILFDKENKILSFASLRSRNHVSFWQW